MTLTNRLLDLVSGGWRGGRGMWVESLLARTEPTRREVTECDPLSHCEAWIIRNLIAVPCTPIRQKQSTTGEDKADSCNLVL